VDETHKPPPRLQDLPSQELICIGGPIDRVQVTLRLFGDQLDPAEVTDKLGCLPTEASRRGAVIRYDRLARTGSWRLEGVDSPSVELPQQVTNLLGRVTSDPAVWRDLTGRFNVDVFCGVYLTEWNRGFTLSSDVLRYLGDRGIEIGFDIYGA
jgi:hypothetical protein